MWARPTLASDPSVPTTWVDTVAGTWLGRREVVECVLASVLAGGHVLLEDTPGVGKTTLARAVAASLGGSFRRIQGTADLLPADITGGDVLGPDRDIVFRQGPIFANVVLVDEINRASPRAQSALLQAMAERSVTVHGRVMPLPRPFMVIATQNPTQLEEGTWPLPSAQLDRFMVTTRVGYPESAAELQVLGGHPERPMPTPLLTLEHLCALQARVHEVAVAETLLSQVLAVVKQSRSHGSLVRGLSPRGGQAWVMAARGRAALLGRDFVIPEDLTVMAASVLAHRVVAGRRISAKDVVAALVRQVFTP